MIRFPLDYRNNCTKTVIQEKGFEETLFTENSLDVVVANVPFADIRLTDNKTLKSITFMIILLNVPLTLYMKVGLSQSLPLLEQWIKGRVFS